MILYILKYSVTNNKDNEYQNEHSQVLSHAKIIAAYRY